METLSTLRHRIEMTRALRSVVTTMKALAAASIASHRRAAESLAEYDRAVETALHAALHSRPEGVALRPQGPPGPVGAIVIGSDQGMCGQFNEHVTGFAVERMRALGEAKGRRILMAVGLRAAAQLAELGQPVETVFSMPSTPAGITPLVARMLVALDEGRKGPGVARVMIFYNQQLSHVTYRPRSRQVYPVDHEWLQEIARRPWPGPSLPTHSVPWERLFPLLLRQFLLVSVYRTVVESLASENASRLAAMQTAERNIDDRLSDLTARYHQQRQQSITEELLDIVGGFEALSGGGEAGGRQAPEAEGR